ncbi:MAG: phage terminase large subunit [Ignavibacteriales bacterium]|nr:phage terminase large subunit [Ignavibacteriales bacterium]
MQWLEKTDAKWYAKEYRWQFPSGANLTFGYLQNENDKYRYQSSAYQFIGIDELTEFTESQYVFLFSRLRKSKDMNIPLRMRSASNPGGIGHVWVKDRFILKGLYVPATLEDNPYIDKESYEDSLNKLDHITREQLRHGNWDISIEGSLFKRQWFEIVEDYPKDLNKVRYWDLAATVSNSSDWTVGCLLGEKDGIYYVLDIKRIKGTPLEVEKLIRQTAILDGTSVEIYMEQEPGSSGVNNIDHYQRQVLNGFIFYPDKKSNSKELRARPVSSAAEAGNIKLVRGSWNDDFLDEIEAFPQGEHDDQIDALSGAFEKLNSGEIIAFSLGRQK